MRLKKIVILFFNLFVTLTRKFLRKRKSNSLPLQTKNKVCLGFFFSYIYLLFNVLNIADVTSFYFSYAKYKKQKNNNTKRLRNLNYTHVYRISFSSQYAKHNKKENNISNAYNIIRRYWKQKFTISIDARYILQIFLPAFKIFKTFKLILHSKNILYYSE